MKEAGDRISAELLMGGFMFFQYVHSAGRLGLFTYLERKPASSLSEVSAALEIPLHSARVLLLGCCSVGVVEKRNGKYFNAPGATTFDARNGSGAFDIISAFHSIIYPAMSRLHDSLVAGTNAGLEEIPGKGETLYERLGDNPELSDAFNRYMACIGQSGLRNERVHAVIAPTLERTSHLLDCGGGDGQIAISLCRTFPHLRVTVFDLPHQCESGAENVRAADLEDRISFHPGDIYEDPLPEGPDTVLFSHVLSMHSESTNRRLLKKTFDSLEKRPDGGAVVIYSSFSNAEETGSMGAAMLSAYFLCLATGEGMIYPLEDLRGWLRDAGFGRVVDHRLPRRDKAFIVGLTKGGEPASIFHPESRRGQASAENAGVRIGVLGSGTAGLTLATGLVRAGHAVCLGARSPDNPRPADWAKSHGEQAFHGTYADAAAFGQILLNCIAGQHCIAGLHLAGKANLEGKILIDLANPLDFAPGETPHLSVCNDDSLGEQIQREFPGLRVVKTLNTMNRNVMVNPRRVEGEHHVFLCGNDSGAKAEVKTLLATAFGWPRSSMIDLGDISSARSTEMAVPLWILLRKKFATPDVSFHVAGMPGRIAPADRLTFTPPSPEG